MLELGESRRPIYSDPSTGSATRSVAPPVPGTEAWGSPTSANSVPWGGTFGPVGVPGPWPPRARRGANSLNLSR
eukprot:15466181-Alexandrium_andersonii.AAC.1